MSKVLPKEFPIKYAIYIKEHLSKDVPENIKKVLWNKLIMFLQNNPLDFGNRTIKYGKVTFSFDGFETAQLIELNKDSKWAESLSNDLQEHLSGGTFSHGVGNGYSIGLISYGGMLDVPLFWRILNNNSNPMIKDMFESDGYIYSEYNIKEIARIYDKIKEGDTGWLERNRTLNRDEVFELTIPYSDLWACLDLSQNKGIVSPMQNEIDIDINKKVIKRIQDSAEKIRVVCSKSLFSIIKEEIFSLYKVTDFCKCCHKPLPFNNRSISYCPNTPENKACYRKRSAIRKKKSSK